MTDSVRDDARREVAARGLTPAAVAHLTHDALGTIDFAVLAPVKKRLKQFFSAESWTEVDDRALADLIGAGTGWWRHDLDDDFQLEFGWRGGAFRIDVAPRPISGATFAGPVTPEATPNPRTIRFVTPPIHEGPSRWYESAPGVDDPRVARLFAEFDDIANVLVGPTFVAVGVHRPERWEQLLDPMLRAVTTEFADTPTESAPALPRAEGDFTDADSASARDDPTALEHAWKELGALRPDVPAELDQILASASAPNRAARQVAARRLTDADTEIAARVWSELLADQSRGVRRAVVDAMVDVERPELRPLLERALHDDDAWTRWKALRGIVDLGIASSRAAIAPLADDPDFRVRLEVARALPDLTR